jgi:hypothetical protein
MQSLLSFLVEAIAIASVVYFAIGFVLTVRAHAQSAPVELITESVETIEVVAVEVPVAEIVVPEPVTIEWSALSPEQLRKECSARAIKWRNAHARNKHLKKAEMVAALAGSST